MTVTRALGLVAVASLAVTGGTSVLLSVRAPVAAVAPPGGAGPISASGTVGPLRIDRSTAVQVQAFAGPAEYIGAGALRPLIHQFASFIALGYGCRHVPSGGIPTVNYNKRTGQPGDSHVVCLTVYLVNQNTGTFAGFTTSSRSFHTAGGVHPGSSLAEAKRLERHYYLSENPPAINERNATAWLSLEQSIVRTNGSWRPGKTIASFTLESRRHPVGLQFV
jgi:hypothetical protein